jgi:ribonuclease P protein component
VRFLKTLRLRKKSEFIAVKKHNTLLFGSFILVEKKIVSPNLPTRIGITVTRKWGKSHERNRFKRITREAFRLSFPLFSNGLEIVVKPRSKAKTAQMQDIQKELTILLTQNKPQ